MKWVLIIWSIHSGGTTTADFNSQERCMNAGYVSMAMSGERLSQVKKFWEMSPTFGAYRDKRVGVASAGDSNMFSCLEK